jgi:hypothetical protein
MNDTTKLLLALLALLIIIMYVYYYKNYKKDVVILQTYLDKAGINIFYEKYPVVIYDQIIDPRQLLKTLFQYSYMFQTDEIVDPDTTIVSKSKFTLVWYSGEAHDDLILKVISPGQDSSDISIKLKKQQVVILPAYWGFQSNIQLNCIRLDDLLSILVSKF